MISFWVAVRFLKSGRAQTALIIVGIAIAISVQIFVGLLIDSLQISLVDSTIGNSPHITISSSMDKVTIRRWDAIVKKIHEIGSVKVVAAAASSNAFARKGSNTAPVLVRGFEFDSADRIYSFSDAIYEGQAYKTRGEILVGKGLREELELGLGDKLTIRTPSRSDSTFTISGFYDIGVASIDKSWIITTLDTAQALFGYGNRITEIEVTVNDLFAADSIAGRIERTLKDDAVKVESWKELNQQLLSGLEGQRISSIIIQAVILISVIVAISSVLMITVLQKSRQIGILKAMGIKDRAASLIFIYQGFLIGLVGSIVGIALGMALLYSFTSFTTSADGSPLIDIYVRPDFIVRSWLIALLASTLAGVIPARRSLKLSPVDVIREG